MAQHDDVPSPIPWPPIIFVALLGAGGLLTWLAAMPILPRIGGRIWPGLGLVVVSAAVAVAAAAAVALRHAATTVRADRASTALVETGIFGYSRNPIYVAMAGVLFGLAVGFNSVWFLLAVAIFVVAVRTLAIAREERHLERKFGQAYVNYKRRVPRWFGLPRE